MVHHAQSPLRELHVHSASDLEICLLYEIHDLVARIIFPDLYRVSGTAPEQAVFKSSETFELFAIRTGEVVVTSWADRGCAGRASEPLATERLIIAHGRQTLNVT